MGNPKPTPFGLDEIATALHRHTRGPGWDLLSWLAEARYLTNDLVAMRYYPTPQGIRSASDRMALLSAWGLITQRPMPRSRKVWHLTDKGAKLLSDFLSKTPREFGFDGAEGRVQEAYIRHRLDVTMFEVALRLHLDNHGGTVTSLVREPYLKTVVGEFRPDLAAVVALNSTTCNLAVEVDRDTERPARFAATKLPKYEALSTANWPLHWDSLPTCLVVTTAGGPERIERLKAAIDAAPVTDGSYRLFKFATARQLYQVNPSHMGRSPEIITRFHDPVCIVARKPLTERRAVLT